MLAKSTKLSIENRANRLSFERNSFISAVAYQNCRLPLPRLFPPLRLSERGRASLTLIVRPFNSLPFSPVMAD